ncbi:Aste57867_12659 [Aphanomyces stellatus]|uniref:Aste57867_12659 protein n=1 Tax=Aphanomyces stellatus TaxID=120398 RepID=A0A485KW62_9STRA|nr:hypothetical protein As57867_012613 [Aphanomyces stellatus]VFT89509.1 Aste57867_12659 [Aphanomyces stellatus]
MDGGQGDSIVLEEEIDPNYEPTEDEVLEYAKWLGMDLDAERDLFWIAREGLKAPLPENWKPCKTTDTGEIYYFNFASGASTWDHPCDEYYRKLYDDHKKKTVQGKKFQDTDDKKKKEKEDVAEILGKKSKKAPKKAPKVETLSAVKSGLDKKPLGAIGKMPLPGGLGALKPVGGLGKPNSLRPPPTAAEESDDDDEKEEEKTEVIKALPSRKPLGKKDAPAVDHREELDNKTQELEAKLRELEEDHADKVAALEAKVKEREDELRVEEKAIEKKIQKLQNDHSDEVESVKELEKKLTKRRKDLDAEHREYLDNAETKFNDKKRELQRKQEKELKDIEEKHKTTLDEMEHAHERELQKQEELRRKAEMQQEHREKEESNKLDKLTHELETLKNEVLQYKRQVKTLEEKLRDEEDKNSQPPEAVAELEASVETLTEQVDSLKKELHERENEVKDQTAKLKRHAEEIAELKQTRDEERSVEPANANKQVEDLEEKIAALRQQVQAEQEKTRGLETKTSDLDASCKAWEKKFNESEEARKATSSPWESKYNEVVVAQKRLEEGHAVAILEWNAKVKALEKQSQQPTSTRTTESDEWKAKYDALASNQAALDAALKTIQSEKSDLEKQCNDLTMSLRRAEAEYTQLRDEVDAGTSKATSQGAMVDELHQAKKAFEAALQDQKTAHDKAIQHVEGQLRAAKADAESVQAQYDQLLSNSSQDEKMREQIQSWQHKYDALQSLHDSETQAMREQIEALESKAKALERDKTTEKESWSKKLADVQEEDERHLAQAKATIADLQAKWTSLASQESSTSGLVASLQEQLDQAYRQAQESQDALEERERKHQKALDATTVQWKGQLDELQTSQTLSLQAVKSELVAAESAKRKLEDARATLERKCKQKESEVASLTAQMHEQHKATTESTNSIWEWEVEKLKTQLRAMEGEKTDVESRLEALRVEHDALVDTHHRLALEKDLNEKKAKQSDTEKDALVVKLKGAEKDVDALQTKWRAQTLEATELKAGWNKAKLSLQSVEAQLEKAQEECRGLEGLVKQQRDAADKYQHEARALQLQLDDALFQKQRVEHDQLTLQHEVDRLKEQTTTMRTSSASALTSSGEQESLRQQVDQLTSDARAANDKVRQWQGKAQEFETKFKQSQDTYDRHLATWTSEKQAVVDKLEKLKSQHQQLDRAHRTISQEKDELAVSLEHVTQEKQDLEKRLKQQQEALVAVQAKVAEYVHQVDEAEAQKRTLGYDMQALESKAKRSEGELERTKSELAHRSKEKDELEIKWRQDVAQLESKLKSLRQEQTDTWNKRTVDEDGKRDALAEKWKKELEEKKKEWQSRQSTLESEKAMAQTQLSQVTNDLTLAQKDMEHVSALKQKLEAQVKSLSEQLEKEHTSLQEQIDQLKAKLKSSQAEKDELMVALASSAGAMGSPHQTPPQFYPSPVDNMSGQTQLKLQMAQVNKTELEAHLQDVTLQCDTWRRKATVLDSRSRDQALEMEALHVENAALRAATQRMQLSAVESLATVERLNYEHKKRMLRSEYMAQLREFSEREELALARQKARVRASCERQLEELVAEFEKHKLNRMEQEERDFQNALAHCQNENQIKLSHLLKDHRDNMTSMERDIQEKQQKHIHSLTKQMQEEEDHLAARLRDTKQINREEDLSKLASLQPGTFEDTFRWKHESNNQDKVATSPPLMAGPSRSPKRKKGRVSTPRHKKSIWAKRIQKEQELVQKAKQYLAKQKKSLKQRMAKLQDEKEWWQRQPTYNTKARQDMKHLLEQHAEQLATDARELKATERWMVKREQTIHKMQATCNHDEWRETNEDDEDDAPSDSSVEVTLERLHGELVMGGSNMSAHLRAYARDQEHTPVLPWPSETQPRQECIVPTPSYAVHPMVTTSTSNNRWLYHRPPERVSAYEPYTTSYGRTPLYDTKLSNWVHKRERASAAAHAHSNYLHQLSQELKVYSTKYKAEHSEGELP